nr:MAG TPA: Protein of unknown function (DUF2508) [Bacteriophage sp.]
MCLILNPFDMYVPKAFTQSAMQRYEYLLKQQRER